MTLVGLGAMGLRHARVFAGSPERFEVVGGYDVRPEALPPPAVTRLASESEAIALGEVVVVATPMSAHAATTSRALAAGRHVLTEKPLCASCAEADTLLAACNRGPGRLFVGHSERFNPVVRALARLVRGDSVVSIALRRAGPSRASECGVLMNLGVHDFDLAAYLTGGAITLRGAVGSDDFAEVVFESSAGAIGHLSVDRTLPERRRALTVTTTRWIYDGDLLGHRLTRMARETGACSEVPLPMDEPLAAQARALADALDGGPPREIAGASDGAAAVALAEQAATHCTSTAPIVHPSGLRGVPR